MPRPTMIERYIETMKGRPNECWPYPGFINKQTGYGAAYLPGRRIGAHHAAYELLVGAVPRGMELDHLCRFRACCNPHHLEPVTHRINLLRGDSPSAHQARQTACIHGHPLSGDNLWIDRRGRRHCETCRTARMRAYYYRKVGRDDPGLRADYRTHCKRGHAKLPNSKGKPCPECQALHRARYRAEGRYR